MTSPSASALSSSPSALAPGSSVAPVGGAAGGICSCASRAVGAAPSNNAARIVGLKFISCLNMGGAEPAMDGEYRAILLESGRVGRNLYRAHCLEHRRAAHGP